MNRRHFCNSFIILFSVFLFTLGIAHSAEILINRIDGARGGEHKTVEIQADGIASLISGFNLLLAYNGELALIYRVSAGEIFDSCSWEYFTYRHISKDTVAVYYPGYDVPLINIIGLASLSGTPPPTCELASTTLATLEVQLRHAEGSFSDQDWIWFSFFWRDCNDNILFSTAGDTVYSASQLFENRSSFSPRDPVAFAFPGYGIPDQPCSGPDGEAVNSNLDFVNSGIWSFLIDPVEECYNGDLNCNGIHFELADFVTFTNIFLYGLGACQCPLPICIEQTDTNCDGLALSVADLVFMIRVIIGEQRLPKPTLHSQFAVDPYLTNNGSGGVEISSKSDLAAAFVRVYARDGNSISLSEFDISSSHAFTGQVGDTFNLLIADIADNKVFEAGQNTLFQYNGNAVLDVVGSVVDIFGNETLLKLETATLPESPELLQNYPNPFNPSTTIEFSLPSLSKWQIEIHNVTGQLINMYNGAASGKVVLKWDGTNIDNTEVASGVYFYKLVTNDQTASRKMLLLK